MADLIVVENDHHHDYKLPLTMPLDLHLLRDTDVPVLFVDKKPWLKNGVLTAALDLDESEVNMPNGLNDQLVEESQYIAQLLDFDVQLLTCFLNDDLTMSCHTDDIEHRKLSPKEEHIQKILAEASQFQIPQERCRIEEGLPDDVLPRVVKEHQSNILILGARSHQGILGRLRGHTSEYVIDKLDSDMLAYKAVH